MASNRKILECKKSTNQVFHLKQYNSSIKIKYMMMMENNLEQEQQQQILPPHPNESPLSHEWFRYRLEEFIRRCDATVNQIVHGNNKNRVSDFFGSDNDNDNDPDFSLPSTDELIGLPPSSRGTHAYSRATKSLKDRLVREIRIMEAAIENGFATLATTEKSLMVAKKEVKDLRSILAQYSPSRNNNNSSMSSLVLSPNSNGNLTPRNSSNNKINENSSNINNNGLLVNNGVHVTLTPPTLAPTNPPIFPSDALIHISEEQEELKQLQDLLKSVEMDICETKKQLRNERAALKETCDTAVKCNAVSGNHSPVLR